MGKPSGSISEDFTTRSRPPSSGESSGDDADLDQDMNPDIDPDDIDLDDDRDTNMASGIPPPLARETGSTKVRELPDERSIAL